MIRLHAPEPFCAAGRFVRRQFWLVLPFAVGLGLVSRRWWM